MLKTVQFTSGEYSMMGTLEEEEENGENHTLGL